MKQVGIPTCPYCGRKVNLIRMWTLKRDGEFVCPGCGGISNVYHAPVMTLFAAVCAVIAFVIFAVTRFILDQVNLMTCIYVFLPFAVFFVGSMFLVQLREPVVRQGRRESAAARGMKPYFAAASGRRLRLAGKKSRRISPRLLLSLSNRRKIWRLHVRFRPNRERLSLFDRPANRCASPRAIPISVPAPPLVPRLPEGRRRHARRAAAIFIPAAVGRAIPTAHRPICASRTATPPSFAAARLKCSSACSRSKIANISHPIPKTAGDKAGCFRVWFGFYI